MYINQIFELMKEEMFKIRTKSKLFYFNEIITSYFVGRKGENEFYFSIFRESVIYSNTNTHTDTSTHTHTQTGHFKPGTH